MIPDPTRQTDKCHVGASHTCTRTRAHPAGHKRDFEVTVIVLPVGGPLQDLASFLSLIRSLNSSAVVPLRTHVSRLEVVADTFNLKGK